MNHGNQQNPVDDTSGEVIVDSGDASDKRPRIEYKKLSEDSYEIDQEAHTISFDTDTNITSFVLSDNPDGPTEDDIWYNISAEKPNEIMDTEVKKKYVYYKAGASDYVVSAGEVIVTIGGRQFIKKNYGGVYCGYIHSADGWTIPILVGTHPDTVQYYTSYDPSITFSYFTTMNYAGFTWYISGKDYSMQGTFYDTSGKGRTLYSGSNSSNVASAFQEVAKKIIDQHKPTLAYAANELLISIGSREYYKKYGETAYCSGITYKNGSTSYMGPILVGTTANSVAFSTNYDSVINTYGGSFYYKGICWYYSGYGYSMLGGSSISSANGRPWYTSSLQTTAAFEEVAKKMIDANPTAIRNLYYFDVNPTSGISTFDIQIAGETKLTGQNDYCQQLYQGATATISNIVAKTGYHYTNYTVSGGMSASGTINCTLGSSTGAISLNSALNTYYIVYNKGTATSGTLPSKQTATYGSNITLGTNSMARSNTNLGTVTFNYNGSGASNTTGTAYTTYAVNGWATSSGGGRSYTSGQSVSNLTTTNGGTINLYPCFSSTAHSPTFPTPSRTGYTFAGWYTAASGGTKVTSYTGSTAVTYYAHWTANTYTVTLNRNSGTGGTASVTATYNSAMPSATMPTRTGYKFQGYYDTSAASGGTQYYTAAGASARAWNKTAATTLYARWTANTYTVTLNTNGGIGGTASVTATYDSAMPSATMPTKTGYTFAGYYDTSNASGGTQYYTAAGASARAWNKTAATTLYARWTANSYKLTVNPNGGTWGGKTTNSEYTKNIGTELDIAAPTRTGYTFSNWSLSGGGWIGQSLHTDSAFASGTNGVALYNNAGDGTVTLTRQAKSADNPIGNYELRIVTSSSATPGYGGFYQNTISGANQKYIHVFVAKLPVGYEFEKQQNPTGNGSTSQWLTSTVGTGEFTTYAYLLTAGSTGTFSTFGHVDVKKVTGKVAPTFYLAYSDVINITSTAGTQKYIFGGAPGTITAQWTANTYTVTLNNQSATTAGSTSVTATYDSNMPSITKPTKTGYTFGGYYTSTGGGGTQYYTAAGASARKWDKTAATTLYAKWTANSYVLTKMSNENLITNGTFDAYSVVDAPSRTGNGVTHTWDKTLNGIPGNTEKAYSANGWGTGANMGVYVPEIGYHAHMRIVNGNNVFRYKTNENYNGKTQADVTGGSVTNGTVTTSRWLGISQVITGTKLVAGKKYAITMDVYRVSGTNYVNTGLYHAKNSNSNYTFYSGTGNLIPTETGAWQTLTYIFTLDTDYKNSSNPSLYVYGYSGGAGELYVDNIRLERIDTVELGEIATSNKEYATAFTSSELTGITRQGYTFDGWYNNSSYTTKLTTSQSLTNSMATFDNINTAGSKARIYAKWNVNTYTISLNNQSATSPGSTAIYEKYLDGYYKESTLSNKMSTSANGISIPSKTGYTFGGYYTSINGGGQQYIDANGKITSTALAIYFGTNVTLYAKWTANQYTIKYNQGTASSTTVPSSQTATYDTNITLATNSMTKNNTDLGTVTFNYNGSGTANTTSKAYNTYAADGWATSSGGTRAYTSGQSVKNLTSTSGGTFNLYPCFTATPHSATFPSPTRTGYTFAGWYTEASGGTQVTSYTGSSNVTYYAHWTINQYYLDLNYNLDGNGQVIDGTSTSSGPYSWSVKINGGTATTGTGDYWKQHDYNSTYEVTITPNDGYTTTTPTFTGTLGAETKVLTIILSTTTYNISYTMGGGTNNASNPATYNVRTADITLADPTRTGYTFTGWTGNGTTTPTKNLKLTQGSTGDKTYTANWTPNTNTAYKVNHYVHDLGTDTYTLNSTDNLTGTTDATLTLANLKKTIAGFTYMNGFADEGSTTRPTSGAVTTTTIKPDGTRVINLYYRPNYLYVQYDMNGGSLAAQHGSTYGSSGSLVTETHNTVPTQFLRGIYGGKVGYVNSTTYAVNTTGLHNYNNSSELNIEKTGYTAKTGAQWNTKADGTGTSYDQDVSTYNATDMATACGVDLSTGDKIVTLYVNWTTTSYTVTCEDWFVDSNNTKLSKLGQGTKTYYYGETARGEDWGNDQYVKTTATNPRGYYVHYGYLSDTSTIVTSNTTVYRYFGSWLNITVRNPEDQNEEGGTVAKFDEKIGTANWTTSRTDQDNSLSLRQGDKAYIRNIAMQKDYYALDEVTNATYDSTNDWYVVEGANTETNSVLIKTKYKTYNITYNLNSGTVGTANPTTYTYVTDSFTLNNPTRSGYTFVGWSGTGLTGNTNQTVTIAKGSTGNKTFTANWIKKNYSITNNGTTTYFETLGSAYATAKNLTQPVTINVEDSNTDGSTFTVESGKDITLNIPEGKTITKTAVGLKVNSGGKLSITGKGTLQTAEADSNELDDLINSNGNLEITDSTIHNKGHKSKWWRAIYSGNGNVIIHSGTIKTTLTSGVESSKKSRTIGISNKSNLTIHDGTIYNNIGITIEGWESSSNNTTGTITIYSGDIVSEDEATIYMNGDEDNNSDINVTITGGKIITSSYSIFTIYTNKNTSGKISISGGTIESTNSDRHSKVIEHHGKGKLTISGTANITSEHGRGIVSDSNIEILNGNITAYDECIHLEPTGNLTVRGGSIRNGAGVSAICQRGTGDILITGGIIEGGGEAIYTETTATGNLTITGGTIIGQSKPTLIIKGSGTVTIGTAGDGVNTESPIIKSDNGAIQANSGFNFYDGILMSKQQTVHTGSYAPETGYDILSGSKDGYYTETLSKKVTVTYNAQGGSVSPTSKVVLHNGTYGTLPEPTKKGYTFNNWQQVPEGYQQVEYIESTGTQYIDTGYIPTKNTEVELELSFEGTFDPGKPKQIFGVREGDNIFSINFGGNADQNNTLFPWANRVYENGGVAIEAITITDEIRTNRNTLRMEPGKITYGTVSRALTIKENNHSTNPLYLFRHNGYAAAFGAYNMKLYRMTIHDGDTLVRNFIPCYRISDGRAGLYDTVTNEFYTNPGSDNFEKGSDVSITSSSIVTTPADHTIYAHWTANLLNFDNQTITKTYSTNSQTANVTAATNGTGTYTYAKKSGADGFTVSSAGVITIPGSKNAGTYTIVITATDSGSNVTQDATYTIKINKANMATPTVSINTDGKVSWGAVTGATGYEISFDNYTWASATSGVSTIPLTSSGTKTAYVKAITTSGNYNTPSDIGSATVTVYGLTLNKGTGISSVTGAGYYVSGKQISINANVSTGYTWKEWTTASGGTTPASASTKATTVTIGANTTLTATTTANTYTVTLNRNNGSGGTASVTATYDSNMPSATMPTRTGYTFQGYYDTSAATGGTQYYTSAGASARTWNKAENTTLYARWTANKYTVTLNRNNGSGGTESVTATYDAAMPSATMPTRAGYTFEGYYDTSEATGGTEYYTSLGASARTWNKASNATLYARWTKDNYRITYNNVTTNYETLAKAYEYAKKQTGQVQIDVIADEVIDASSFTVENQKDIVLNIPEGRTITKTTAGLVVNSGGKLTIQGKGTLKTPTANSTNMSNLISNRGTLDIYEATVTHEGIVTDNTSRYWFAIWTSGGGSTTINSGTINCLLTEGQTSSGHGITIDLEGSANLYVKGGNVNCYHEGAINAWADATNSGEIKVTGGRVYSKNASAINSNAAEGKYNSINVIVESGDIEGKIKGILLKPATDGDITIKGGSVTAANGVGVENQGTGDILIEGGNISSTGAATVCASNGGTITIQGGHIEPTGANSGIYVDNNQTVNVIVTGGEIVTTAKAINVGNQATVTIGTLGDGVNTESPIIKGDNCAVYAPNGFNFYDGILMSKQQTVHEGSYTPETGYDILSGSKDGYYTEVLSKKCTVTLNKNNGTGGTDSVIAINGATMPSATMPTRTGYTFAGYYDTSAATGGTQYYTASGASARTWNKTSDATLYARWTPKNDIPYVVKHMKMNLDGTAYTVEETQNLTGTTDTSVTPAVKNYTGFTSPSTQTKTINGDGSTVIEYRYARNKYYLDTNYMLDGVYETMGSEASRYGTFDVYVRGNLVEENVSGIWLQFYYGSTFEIKNITAKTGKRFNESKSTNLTGTIGTGTNGVILDFTTIFEISYDLDGGSLGTENPETYDFYTNTFTLNNPTKTGYAFTGWTGSNGNTPQISVSISQGSTGDKTYTANWAKNSYTATYNTNGGSVSPTSKVVTYDSAYGELATPTKTGYTFSNWQLVPEEYQQVDYIESTGTQWIDTGVKAKPSTKTQIKFNMTAVNPYVIFGSHAGSDTIDYRFFNTLGQAYVDFPGGTGNGTRLTDSSVQIPAGETFELEIGNYYLKNLETRTNLLSGSYVDFDERATTLKMWRYDANATNSRGKLYYLKIFDGDTLVRNFIPCYRISDGRAGLYDTVTNEFYTNPGSDNFEKGSDVNITSSSIVQIPSDHNLYAHWAPNNYTITYEYNYDNNDMNTWNYKYGERFTTTYDSNTNMSTVACAGSSGWEYVYYPIETQVGQTYTINFDYEIPATYTTWGGYDGIAYHVSTQVPSDGTTITNSIVTQYLPKTATSSRQTATLTFTATSTTTYFAFNYGTVTDGVTTTLKLGNFKITQSVTKTYGNTMGTLPTITRTGYTFKGWYSEATNGTQITESTAVPAGDTTYYAHWAPKPLIFNNQTITKTYSTNSQTANVTAATNGTGSYTYAKKSGESDITVSNAGVITIPGSKNAGTYTIVITATDRMSKVTKDATYTIKIDKIPSTLNVTSASVEVNAQSNTTVTYTYDGDGMVSVASSNTGIATASVNRNTKTITINGISFGTATITVSAAEGTNYLAAEDKTITVNVKRIPGNIALNKSRIYVPYGTTSVNIAVSNHHGGTLSAAQRGTNIEGITTSVTSSVVTVGGLSTLNAGTAIIIRVTSSETGVYEQAYAECGIDIIKADSVLSLVSSTANVNALSNTTIGYVFNGDGVVSATSDDTNVATVSVNPTDHKITIHGVSYGTATITVSAAEGTNYLAPESRTISVSVNRIAGNITLDKYTEEVEYGTASVTLNVTEHHNGGTITAVQNGTNVEGITTNVSGNVVTVGGLGGLNAGTKVTIRVTSGQTGVYNSAYADYTVTIIKKIPVITLAKESVQVNALSSVEVTYTYDGDGTVSVASSNTNVATASVNTSTKKITINGLAYGTIDVTVSAGEGANYSPAEDKTIRVQVNRIAGYITLNKATEDVIYGTASTTLQIVSHHNGANLTASQYETSVIGVTTPLNNKIVTINGLGRLTAGTRVKVRVTAGQTPVYNSSTADFVLTIVKANSEITLSSIEETVNALSNKTVTYTYNGDGRISVSSSNTDVATVDVNRDTKTITISGLTYGDATITVSANAGTNYNAPTSKTISVHVNRIAGNISLSKSTEEIPYGTTSTSVNVTRHHGGSLSAVQYETDVPGVVVTMNGITANISGLENVPGICTIKVRVTSGQTPVYESASADFIIEIIRAAATLTVNPNVDSVTIVKGNTLNVTYSTDGDGEVLVHSQNQGVATIVRGSGTATISGVAVGETTVKLYIEATQKFSYVEKVINVTVLEANYSNNNVNYFKLSDAVENAGTVTVLRIVNDTSTEIKVDKNIVLDVAGYTVTLNGIPIEVETAGTLNVIGSDGGKIITSNEVGISNPSGALKIGRELGDITNNPTIEAGTYAIQGSVTLVGGTLIGTNEPPLDTSAHVLSLPRDYTEITTTRSGNKYISTIQIEKNPPVIRVTPSTTEFTNEPVILTVKITDAFSGVKMAKYTIGGTTKDLELDNNGLGEITINGNVIVRIYAEDNAGNSDSFDYEVRNIDTHPEDVTSMDVENLDNNTAIYTTVVFKDIRTTDDHYISKVFFSNTSTTPQVNTDGWIPYDVNMRAPWALDFSTGNGEKVVYIWVMDTAKNISTVPFEKHINLKTSLIGQTANKLQITFAGVDKNFLRSTLQDGNIMFRIDGNLLSVGNRALQVLDSEFEYSGKKGYKYQSTLTNLRGAGRLDMIIDENTLFDKAGNKNVAQTFETGYYVDTNAPIILIDSNGVASVTDAEGNLCAVMVNGVLVSRDGSGIGVVPVGATIKAYDRAGNVAVATR